MEGARKAKGPGYLIAFVYKYPNTQHEICLRKEAEIEAAKRVGQME